MASWVQGYIRHLNRKTLSRDGWSFRTQQQDEALQAKRKHNHSTPFYQLPGELRNHIYDLCLECSNVINLKHGGDLEDGLHEATVPRGFDSSTIVEIYSKAVTLFSISHMIRNEAKSYFFGERMFEILPSSGVLGDLYPVPAIKLRSALEMVPRSNLAGLQILIYDPKFCIHGDEPRTQAAGSVVVAFETLKLSVAVDYYVNKYSTSAEWTVAEMCQHCKLEYQQTLVSLQGGEEWKQVTSRWFARCEAGTVTWKDMMRVLKVVMLAIDNPKTSWDPLTSREKRLWNLQVRGLLPIKGRLRHYRQTQYK